VATSQKGTFPVTKESIVRGFLRLDPCVARALVVGQDGIGKSMWIDLVLVDENGRRAGRGRARLANS
jgi:hypothetical protein